MLWSHTILYSRFEIGFLGLINGLQVTIFIALFFLTAASAILWTSKENHSKLLCLQLIILLSVLWLVPVITGGSHPFTNETYEKIGLGFYIAETGGFSSQEIWYLSWPGALVLLATIAELGVIDYEPIRALVISLTPFLLLPPLYLFLKNVVGQMGRNYHWAGLLLFSVANWTGDIFIHPQGTGYFLLLVLFGLMTMPSIWKRNGTNIGLLALSAIVFAALVPTHLLTSLVGLIIWTLLCIVKRNPRGALIIVLFLVLLVSWDITEGPRYIPSISQRPLVNVPSETVTTPVEPDIPAEQRSVLVLDPDLLTQREVTGRFSGSESHVAVARVRLVISVIFALVGAAGAFLLLLRKRFASTIILLIITLASLSLLPLSGHYANELIRRLYLFALPGMAYFGIALLEVKSRIPIILLSLLIVISYPLHIIAHYGNQELDYVHPGQVTAMDFFDSNTRNGYITGSYPLGYTKRFPDYYDAGFDQLHWQDNKLVGEFNIALPHYIGISRWDRARYEWFLGDKQSLKQMEDLLANATNFNLMYKNPAIKLYQSDAEMAEIYPSVQ
ncbi:hypothetical protein ACFLV3_01555 [Chloroflexota bacterium]